MNPRRDPHGRSPARASVALVSIAVLASLAGCSSGPHEIVGPARASSEYTATSEPSLTLAPPPVLDRWRSPRISVWTDGWRRVQARPGVSLEPGSIFNLEIPEQQAVTFHWSARAMTGQGEVIGSRWAVDLEDITDETPRSGPDDVTHWSAWSATETSATVGPFAAGPDPHYFFVEARDNLGFFSLVTVRLGVLPASAEGAEGLRPTRR